MHHALDEAKIAFKNNEVPVGSVIIHRASREIIARSNNLVETKNNPILHAEILSISKACDVLQSKNLSSCDMYVTLEPCFMCACAISHSRLKCLFYGAYDLKHGAIENNLRFFTSKECFHRPEIYGGILETKSNSLMKLFFQKLRNQE
jgi:cytosine deaminase